VHNQKRFEAQYGDPDALADDVPVPSSTQSGRKKDKKKPTPKPRDHQKLFAGNIDGTRHDGRATTLQCVEASAIDRSMCVCGGMCACVRAECFKLGVSLSRKVGLVNVVQHPFLLFSVFLLKLYFVPPQPQLIDCLWFVVAERETVLFVLQLRPHCCFPSGPAFGCGCH